MQYVGIPTYCFLYDGSPVGAGDDGWPGMTEMGSAMTRRYPVKPGMTGAR